jgi:pimeloyl-ACP methyl ester carboxylesterase
MTSLAPQPGVVLVHGAYADGSSWSEVIERLQRAGLAAAAVQNPLTSLADDVAHTRRILALHDGPVILAGHSFAGTVITEAGIDPRVAGLVYIAARAPDAGEDYAALAQKFPAPPANAGLVYTGGFGGLTEDAFLTDFASASTRSGRACSMRCKDASRNRFSTKGPQRRPGGRNHPGMPSRGRTARSRRSFSAFSPNA